MTYVRPTADTTVDAFPEGIVGMTIGRTDGCTVFHDHMQSCKSTPVTQMSFVSVERSMKHLASKPQNHLTRHKPSLEHPTVSTR